MSSVNAPIDNMWNDLMTELESAIDELVPKKIAITNNRVRWIATKLKMHLQDRRSCSRSKWDQVNSLEHHTTTKPTKTHITGI